MPILRTYACETCAHMIEVTLRADQWDQPPPPCPKCATHMGQEFYPVAIGGSNRGRAAAIAEDIAAKDYHVADMKMDRGEGAVPQVRFKDTSPSSAPAPTWGASREVLEGAIAAGRQVRQQHGSGLDMLQGMLDSGAQKDLIKVSREKSMRVW